MQNLNRPNIETNSMTTLTIERCRFVKKITWIYVMFLSCCIEMESNIVALLYFTTDKENISKGS